MVRVLIGSFLLATMLAGCDAPVVTGGGDVVQGNDDGNGVGDPDMSANGTGDSSQDGDGGPGAINDPGVAGACTPKNEFTELPPGDNLGDPFSDVELPDLFVAREIMLLSCIACDGTPLSTNFCELADGETNNLGEDVPAFIRTFSIQINDGEIMFLNNNTSEVDATGGINQDGSFTATGIIEKTASDGTETFHWRFIEGVVDFQGGIIDMFARSHEGASDFLGGGPFDYEYSTQTRYEILVTP